MKPKTLTVKIICDKHTHAGRDYVNGAVIKDMPAASAEWLIANGRAEAHSPAKPNQKAQEG